MIAVEKRRSRTERHLNVPFFPVDGSSSAGRRRSVIRGRGRGELRWQVGIGFLQIGRKFGDRRCLQQRQGAKRTIELPLQPVRQGHGFE